jgi:hypothetical protein
LGVALVACAVLCLCGFGAQQQAVPSLGGQGTEPYEQNTQQSPCFGRSTVPQASHW